MHTLKIDIDNSIYDKFMGLLDMLPKDKIYIYSEIKRTKKPDKESKISSISEPIKNNADILKEYIYTLNKFEIFSKNETEQKAIGTIIIDGILQAGMKYSTVVKPRVDNFIKQYPQIITTSDFKKLMDEKGISSIINWQDNSAKTNRIIKLTNFFISENIETKDDLYEWLASENNIKQFKKQDGIGDKTADYFKILVGYSDTSAIDRHLFGFLHNAEIDVTDYHVAQNILSDTAKLLDIDESNLDYSIWKYMSEL